MKGYLLCFFTLFIFVCGTHAQENPDSLFSVAQKQAYKNHFAEAKHIMVNLEKKYDTNTEYKTFYGALLSWMGKYDTSKAVLRAVIAKSPKNGDAYDNLTDVELWSSDDSMAVIDSKKALALPKADTAHYLMKIAEAEIGMKQFPLAYHLADSLLDKNPNDTTGKNMKFEVKAAVLQKTADSLFDSALHSSYRKDYGQAEKIVVQLVKEYPNNSDYKILWCRLLGYRGKADTSEIMAREIIAKEPQNLDAYDVYADDELVALRFKHSSQLCDTALSMPVAGDKTALVMTKTSAQDNLELYYDAFNTIDTLHTRLPKNEEVVFYYNLIKAHIRQHKADSMIALAENQANRKHYDSAWQNTDTVIVWYPQNMVYQIFKGRLFTYQGKYDSAIKVLDIVIKKAPRNLDAYDAITDAELFKRAYGLTIADCDKALHDSIFKGYPSIFPKKADTALVTKKDSAKQDSVNKALAEQRRQKLKDDSLLSGKIRVAPKDSFLLDSAKQRMVRDTETRHYFTIFMLKRSHALYEMEDYQPVVNTLDTLRERDSTNKDANDLLEEAKIKLLKNMLTAGYLNNSFNAGPFSGPVHYAFLQYMYNLKGCPLSAKITYGSAYDLTIGWREGLQYELGAYPKFGPTTYGDFEVDYSNDFAIFPQWQITGNVNQSLGKGFEVAMGVIYMHFIDVVDSLPTPPQDVWILDPGFSYSTPGEHYLFTYKPYFTYKLGYIDIVHTVELRHFFKNQETWVTLYGSLGVTPFVDYFYPSPVPTYIKYIGADFQTRLPHNWLISPMVAYEYEEYYPPLSLWKNMYYVQITISKRF